MSETDGVSDTDIAATASDKLPRIVWILSVIAICVALGFGIVAPALPIFARNFDVGVTAAGLVISLFAAMRMASAFGVGKVVDRIGARLVLGTGLVVVSVSSLFAGLAQDYVQLLLLRGVGGVGSAMFSVAAASVMANRIPSAVRGRSMSVWSGSFLLGGVLGPVIGGPLTAISLRAPFFFYAGTLAVAAVVAFVALPRVPRPARIGGNEAIPSEGIRHAVRLPAFRVALVGSLSQGWAVAARSTLVPLFITEVLLLQAAWSGYALAIAAAVNAALLLPLGRWSDRRGRLGVAFLGGAAGAVGMAALAAPPALWVLVAAMMVLGIGGAAQSVGPSAIMGDVAQGRRGSVIATYQVTGDVGTMIGPIVAGALADLFGFSIGFAATAALCAVAALVAAPYMRGEYRERRAAGAVEPTGGEHRDGKPTLSDPDDTMQV